MTVLVNISFAISLDERRQKIIQLIDRELKEVDRLVRNVRRSDPKLLLRTAELNLEKARLWKEKENEEFLKIPADQRAKVNKKKYFQRSTRYFVEAKKDCLELIKRFKRFSEISDAYYILAYHYKEFNNIKAATKYFNLANRRSSNKSMTKTKSQVALAEINYNKGDYRKAIPLYEESLRNNVDKWWTKDAFNLAWSYLRVGKANNGLAWMKNIFNKSKDDKFIDMSKYVLRDIGLFFVESGRVDEAISFYKSNNADFSEQVLKLSDKLDSTQAIKVLRSAIKNENRPDMKVRLEMELAESYNKYAKYSSLEIIIASMTDEKNYSLLNQEQKERLAYLAEKNAAELQKKVVSDIYKKVPRTRKKYAWLTVKYFDHLLKIKNDKREEYVYYKGETYFAVYDMNNAIDTYKLSFDEALKVKNSKIQKLSLEGMLACLGSKYLNQKMKNVKYVEVYERYLQTDTKSKRAKDIFQKLFKVHYDENRIEDSISILNRYKVSFPADIIVQEAMIAQIMEFYRNRNDDEKVKLWISKIASSEYRVSSKYRNRLRILLTNIQMKEVESARKSGDKAKALEEYLVIFDSKDSTKSTKKNSAYNISVLYYELGDTQKVYEWANTTMRIMNSSEVAKFLPTFITFTSFLFEKMEHGKSAQLSEDILNKICFANAKEKEQLFSNAIYLKLAENNYKDIYTDLNKFSKCGIRKKTITDVYLEMMEVYLDNKSWSNLEKIIYILEKDRKIHHKILGPLHVLIENYVNISDKSKVNELTSKFNKLYYGAKKNNLNIPVKVRSVVSERMYASFKNDFSRVIGMDLSFSDKTIEGKVKQKLQALIEKLTSAANMIIGEGADEYIVSVNLDLADAYSQVAKQIENIQLPKDKSKEYIASFRGAMSNVVKPLYEKSKEFLANVKNEIYKYSLVSTRNYEVMTDKKIKYNFTPSQALFMEREGSKW